MSNLPTTPATRPGSRSSSRPTRRTLLQAAAVVAAARPLRAEPAEDDAELIRRVTGGLAEPSERVRLQMPAEFGNGYSVPLAFAVDSPMTESDHVRRVFLIASRNPIVLAAVFEFQPQSGRAAVTTRIRLSEPQHVLAVAQMADGSQLLARRWVKVETDGCA